MPRSRTLPFLFAASAMGALFTGACVSTNARTRPVHVVIAAITDVHGALQEHEEAVAGHPGQKIRLGGVALLSGYLANLRATHPGAVVLLDSGDEFQGTLVSNVSEGEPVVEAFNALGLSAAALGNHEFDYGPLGPGDTARAPGDDPLGALKRNIGIAHYPFLAANVFEKGTRRRPGWIHPHTVVEVSGIRLGVIGLATPTTPSVTQAGNVASLDFTDPVAATVASAAELRAQGADAVVVVAHIGGGCKKNDDLADLTTCWDPSEAFDLARKLPPGTIDLFLAGHTHLEMRRVVNGVPLTQALSSLRAFSVVDLWVDPVAHHALSEKTVLRPQVMVCRDVYEGTQGCDPGRPPEGPVHLASPIFEGKAVQPDPSLDRLLAPYLTRVEAKRREALGVRLAAPFRRAHSAESPLGDLLADLVREAVPGADVAILNSGGIRTDLIGPDVTYGALFEMLPFDNNLATLRLTGAELQQLILSVADGTHGLPQVSGLDVRLKMTNGGPTPQSAEVSLADGSPLDEKKLYIVATSDFLAAGGSGFSAVVKRPDQAKVLYDRPVLRDALIEPLKRRAASGPLMPVTDGRLTIERH